MTLSTASSPSTKHVRLLERCYRYAFLSGRQERGLRLSPEEEQELSSLRELEGDRQRRRRGHQRFPLVLHAVVKTPDGVCSGRVLNISGAGMCLRAHYDVEIGDTVQVKVGQPDEVEYIFTCEVVRQSVNEGSVQTVGLAFCCVPVEIRRRAA